VFLLFRLYMVAASTVENDQRAKPSTLRNCADKLHRLSAIRAERKLGLSGGHSAKVDVFELTAIQGMSLGAPCECHLMVTLLNKMVSGTLTECRVRRQQHADVSGTSRLGRS
jgi:hypothetical protein